MVVEAVSVARVVSVVVVIACGELVESVLVVSVEVAGFEESVAVVVGLAPLEVELASFSSNGVLVAVTVVGVEEAVSVVEADVEVEVVTMVAVVVATGWVEVVGAMVIIPPSFIRSALSWFLSTQTSSTQSLSLIVRASTCASWKMASWAVILSAKISLN